MPVIPPPPPPPSPPPPPPIPPKPLVKSPRPSDQNLLRKFFGKEKDKEKDKGKQKEIDKEKKKEDKEQKEKEEKEEALVANTKKLKKSGSLFMFGKKVKGEDRERSRTIFNVPPPHFLVSQPLKRSASAGVVGGKMSEKDHRNRSLSIAGSLID
jgi:hypothetical protein